MLEYDGALSAINNLQIIYHKILLIFYSDLDSLLNSKVNPNIIGN